MQFGENLLVDTGMLVGLVAIDNGELVAKLFFHHWLYYHIEKILHIFVVGVVGIQ